MTSRGQATTNLTALLLIKGGEKTSYGIVKWVHFCFIKFEDKSMPFNPASPSPSIHKPALEDNHTFVAQNTEEASLSLYKTNPGNWKFKRPDMNLEKFRTNQGNWDKNVPHRSRRASRFEESWKLTHSIFLPLWYCLSKGFRRSKSLQNSCLPSAQQPKWSNC